MEPRKMTGAWRAIAGRLFVAALVMLLALAPPAQVGIGTDEFASSFESEFVADFALTLAQDVLSDDILDGNLSPSSEATISELSFQSGISAAPDCGKEVDEVFRAAAAVVDAQFRLDMAKLKLSACIKSTPTSPAPSSIEPTLTPADESFESIDTAFEVMLESSVLEQ